MLSYDCQRPQSAIDLRHLAQGSVFFVSRAVQSGFSTKGSLFKMLGCPLPSVLNKLAAGALLQKARRCASDFQNNFSRPKFFEVHLAKRPAIAFAH